MSTVEAGHFGRYEIRGEIGRGGMATVYRAFDPAFKRDVAIKVLPRELLHDPTFRARFEREAQTIAALEHVAIVPVHDVGESDGQPFIVMRLMTGGSLADRLAAGPLSLTEVSRILTRLAPALDRAHASGVVHRDLKPGNILFDADNEPYIADFGIARLADDASSLTATGVFGTPAYMSPEQARGERLIDGRSDVYALGAMVYQMLSGRLPYEAATPIGMALRHVTEPAPRLSAVRPDLPAGCDTVILCAMAKDPNERLPTAAHLRLAVDAVATGAPLPEWLVAPITPPTPYAVPAGTGLLPPATALATLSPTSLAPAADAAVARPAAQKIVQLWRRSPPGARVAAGVIAVALLIGLGALLATLFTSRPAPTPTAVANTTVAANDTPAGTAPAPTLDTAAVNATVTAVLQAIDTERYDSVSRLTLAAGVEPAVDMMMVARATSNDQRTRHLRLLALDAASAQLRWAAGDLTRAGGDSPLLNTPTHSIVMDDTVLRAFARADGAEAWTLPLKAGLASCNLRACLQLAGDLAVIVTADNVMTGVDTATGIPRWSLTLQKTPLGFFDLGPIIAVYDELQVGVGAARMIDPDTGEARDFTPQCKESGAPVGVQPRTQFVRLSNDVFYVFLGRKALCVQSYDIATLSSNWSTTIDDEAGDGFNYRGQVGAGALFLPSTTGGGILRLDAETGQLTRLAPTPDRLLLPLLTREGQVIARETGAKASSAEALLSLDAATGAVTWRYEFGARLPLESTYARTGVLQKGEAVWAWRSDTAGPMVFTVSAGADGQLTLQLEQLDWATGASTPLQSVEITPPGGDPLVPRLAGWRDRVAWWLFDNEFLLRHLVDQGRVEDIWPPKP